jgi:hypothetical protein
VFIVLTWAQESHELQEVDNGTKMYINVEEIRDGV